MRFAATSFLFLNLVGALIAAQATPPPAAPAADASSLYDLGKKLFDDYAPPEVKAQYEFPSKEQMTAFTTRLQQTLQSGSLEDLAAYAPEARAAQTAISQIPGMEEYADWLDERLDYIDAAGEITAPAGTRPSPTPTPTRPPSQPRPSPGPRVTAPPRLPYYDVWVERVRDRPLPANAQTLIPQLRAAFAAEGLPPELVWLAEAESSLNPAARSPVGAKGLFQLMPETAKALGLSTMMPDERTSPDKSARAAARYLKTLHGRFGSWPLAFAAYNAGEGRVGRALQSRSAKDFAGVASSLPTETRMYVPKVCALIALRAGVPPDKIGLPRG